MNENEKQTRDVDEASQYLERLIYDDDELQGRLHRIAMRTIGIDADVFLEEEHPQYDEYWDVYGSTMAMLLGTVISRHYYPAVRG